MSFFIALRVNVLYNEDVNNTEGRDILDNNICKGS